MINVDEILNVLPSNIRNCLEDTKDIERLQEIRIKINKPIIFQIGNEEVIGSYIPDSSDLKSVLQRISNYSIYAYEEEKKQGYITIKGGHRVGICGSCVIQDNVVKTIKDTGSINIRICREILHCSDKMVKYIVSGSNVQNTIIISPPKCGKTTLLRDITRNLSDGMKEYGFKGRKICVIDERSEIGASFNGIPQMNIGIRTDVLDNCPKSQGIMMAIRSMSPDVIVCDEIGTRKDMESILAAVNCGVNIITTIHGAGIKDLYERIVFKEIIENKVFKRAVILSCRKGVGTIECIYDLDKKTNVMEE